VARASLDVVDPEPLPAGHPLYLHPAVHLSPHVSWSSPATVRRTFDLFADNLERYRTGQPLTGHVDVAAGY
jgi:phosphoglycerate dehydrogenase-like enzyme